MRLKRIFLLFLSASLLLTLTGCETVARKFTRKHKQTEQNVDLVLVPEEYKPSGSSEELYRQYFTYWKSWQDELINSLAYKASLKKKIDCVEQALKNLANMKMLLVAEAQKNFDPYVSKLTDLMSSLKNDTYGANDSRNLQDAERIKAGIEKAFIYPKVKNYLK